MTIHARFLPKYPKRIDVTDGLIKTEANGVVTLGFDYVASEFGVALQQAVDSTAAHDTAAGVHETNASTYATNAATSAAAAAADASYISSLTAHVLTVDSYTALRALTPATGDVVYMQGYYGLGTLGGGIFTWNATSSATHNGGTCIQPAAGGAGRWIRQTSGNVLQAIWFGAKGDGVADDSVAIQAAIDAGAANCVVILPSGDVKIVTGLVISNHRVYLRGHGKFTTKLLFSPTADGTALTVNGSGTLAPLVQGGLHDFSLWSNDTTYTKTAINIIDADIYKMESIGVNGISGWTGGTGSIGLKTNGRDLTGFYDLDINADRPVFIGKNPNSTISSDHYNFHNTYLIGASASFPLLEIEDGANITSLSFSGYQAWNKGAGGLKWIDTTTTGTSQSVSFENIRFEQSLDATQYAFDIQHNTGLYGLVFRNIIVGDRNGYRLRKVMNTSMVGSQYTLASGTAIDADSTNTSIQWINCFWQVGGGATLTGLYQRNASPSIALGQIPISAEYNRVLGTVKSDMPLGSGLLTLANTALGNVVTDDFTGLAIVTSGAGFVASFVLNGGNHSVSLVADPASQFSSTVGTASKSNVYWSATNTRYEIENKTGSSATYTFTFLGRSSSSG